MIQTPSDVLRFGKYVALTRKDSKGCWEWTGSKFRQGYGCFKVNGKSVGAHQFSYETFVGSVPEEMELDHLCRNRACVRPDHLEAVIQRVNWQRGESPSALRSREDRCLHGHLFDEENTYIDANGHRVCRTCSREATRAHRGGSRDSARAWRRMTPEAVAEVREVVLQAGPGRGIKAVMEHLDCSASTASNWMRAALRSKEEETG